MIPESAKNWLRHGNRGISSEVMFEAMTGIPLVLAAWQNMAPADPADFTRCELLLRAVPEWRARLPEMAAVSPVWARLVENWDEILAAIEKDAPRWFTHREGSAPTAYNMMKDLGC